MTEDVVFMTSAQSPFRKKEFAENSGRMREMKLDVRADIQEIEILGNRAFLRNHLQLTLTLPGAVTQAHDWPYNGD